MACLSWILPAAAAEHSPKTANVSPQSVPLLRRACWLPAQKAWDSGVTHDVIQANAAYASCLQNLTVSLLKQHYNL
ncbi:MAG: hypothetical protein CVV27_10855, partial [Candidatus Melainabacteria bacterium HGW-Melainabacteria-1]